MTNSYPSGSPGVPDSSMPTGVPGYMPRRSSYASVVAGAASGQSYPQNVRSGAFSHLLHQHMDSSFDPAYHTLSGHLRNDPRAYDMDFGANGSGHGRSGSWTRGGQLPSFSSAFGSLVNGYGSAGLGGNLDHFFIPSYLKGSKYLQNLEEAHKAKVAAYKDGYSAHSSQPGSLSTSASSVNLHAKMAPSHRGMTYDLIEKAPPMEDEALPPLPSKWNHLDKYGGLEVLSDGQEVKLTGPKSERDRDHESCAIRADHPMPPQCGIYYFEVTIISRKREESSIGIGFSSKTVPLSRLPGWEPESWAYHGDDGHSFCQQSVGKHYGPPFTAGDVIGCGVNFRTGSAFFTKNGDHLGTAFREIKGKLYPSVGMKKLGEHIRVNFGQSPFVYDIDGMMSASSTSYFPPPSTPLFPVPPQSSAIPDGFSAGDSEDADTIPGDFEQGATDALVTDGFNPANSEPANSYDEGIPTSMQEREGPPAPQLLTPPIVTSASFQAPAPSSLQPAGLLARNLFSRVPPQAFTSSSPRPSYPNSPIRSSSIRSQRPAPFIPIRGIHFIPRVARLEATRLGMVVTVIDSDAWDLRNIIKLMRILVFQWLAYGGPPIQHHALSTEALSDLNRIARAERNMISPREALRLLAEETLPESGTASSALGTTTVSDTQSEASLQATVSPTPAATGSSIVVSAGGDSPTAGLNGEYQNSITQDGAPVNAASWIARMATQDHKLREISTWTDDKIQREKASIRTEIEATSTAKLAPPMSETELIQALILQFLTHDGYVETARAFADEVHAEKKALNLDPDAVIPGFDVKEDEDAGHRQRIRAAVLEGDVDKAIKHTNAYYPHVLRDNEHVYFRLRCRKFIEMIRQGAEMQNAATNGSKKSNGHNGDWYDDILNHDMDLDDHQSQNNWDRMDTEEAPENQLEYQRLVEDTLAYGRELQAEFKDDQRREVSKALEDAFALMAYVDPLNAKEVSHLLDPSGRVAVAEELNSAILQSLGKSSSAALEQLYQQTSVLLEELREGGGPGAFVNIDDFVHPKPSYS